MSRILKDYFIRKIIFSFFRDNEYKICSKCNKVCKWNQNKQVRKYLEFKNVVICFSCFKKNFFPRIVKKIEIY